MFLLKVVSPDRELLNKQVKSLVVRTVSGDVCIMSGHIDYVSVLDIGALTVTFENGEKRRAAVGGGMIKVDKAVTTIVANTCEWDDEIDIQRAKLAKERANKYLENPTDSHTVEVATLKLRRAINRINMLEK
ncbi:MAG: ATP synthase F1 subunit epsilon [Oscillospiraceae bacterium]